MTPGLQPSVRAVANSATFKSPQRFVEPLTVQILPLQEDRNPVANL